jgi:hypothetical protein
MRFISARLVIVLLLGVFSIEDGLVAVVQSKPAYASTCQDVKYKVYCVNGRVEVDSHSLEEMISSRGPNVCKLTDAEYNTLSEARASAKQFGGVGASCRCP